MSYGKIEFYDDKVVKKIDCTKNSHLRSWVKEVNYYNSLSHPGILKMENYTISTEGGGKFTIPRGINIILAIKSNLISLKNFITDSLCVVNFLNRNNIVHLDIKVDNFVFHEGRAKIIDFGLSSTGFVKSGQLCYYSLVEYSGKYRDPKLPKTGLKFSTSEQYALGITINFLAQLTDETFEDRQHIQDIVRMLLYRRDIDDILAHPYISKERITEGSYISPGRPILYINIDPVDWKRYQQVLKDTNVSLNRYMNNNVLDLFARVYHDFCDKDKIFHHCVALGMILYNQYMATKPTDVGFKIDVHKQTILEDVYYEMEIEYELIGTIIKLCDGNLIKTDTVNYFVV